MVQFKLENLILRERQEISQEVWDRFVDSSPSAWLYHTYDMQDAIATWPGKSDLSFALVDEENSGEIAALIPLHQIHRPFARVISNSHLESMGGFAYHSNLTAKQVTKVSQTVMDTIYRLANRNNTEEIRVYLSPVTPGLRGDLCPRVNPLIQLGMENNASQTYMINLQKPKEDIWQGMESYCRTHIRKAEKNGITVRHTIALKDLDAYYDLHCKTYHRTNVKPHPYEYFEIIWKKFAATGRAMIFFAESEGKPVAFDVEACFKNALSGWSAAGEGINTSGVNNLLHWSAIQWGLDNQFDWYESGEGFPGEIGGKRKGLTDFKKSFGGELFPIYRGKILRRQFIYNFRSFINSIH